MHPHQESLERALTSLRATHAEVNADLSNPDIVGIKNRVVHNLEQSINYLSLLAGKESPFNSLTTTGQAEAVQPLRKVFGKSLGDTPIEAAGSVGDNAPVQVATPLAIQVGELREKIAKLYNEFLNIDTDGLLDTYSDIELRGVAKAAGLPVTETNPKKINAKYVEAIKEAIKKKAEIEAAGSVGDNNTNQNQNEQ